MKTVPKSETYGFLALYDEIAYNLLLVTEPEAEGEELLALITGGYPKDYIRALYPLPVEHYLNIMLARSRQGEKSCVQMYDVCRSLYDLFHSSEIMTSLLYSGRYRTPMTPKNWIPLIDEISNNMAAPLTAHSSQVIHQLLEDFTETFNVLVHRADQQVAMAITKRERLEFNTAMTAYIELVVKMLTPYAPPSATL
jgi:hypothetical protein